MRCRVLFKCLSDALSQPKTCTGVWKTPFITAVRVVKQSSFRGVRIWEPGPRRWEECTILSQSPRFHGPAAVFVPRPLQLSLFANLQLSVYCCLEKKNHPWPLTSANILLFFFFVALLCVLSDLSSWIKAPRNGAEVFLKHLICSYGPPMEGQQKARKPNRIKSLSQEQRASVARYKYTLTSHTHTHKRHRQRSHRTQAPFTIISSVRTKESLW